MGKRILVLGGAGMLGHKVCQLLPQQGFEVFAAFRNAPASSLMPFYQNVQIVDNIDVMNDAALNKAFNTAKPDVVINCIGIVKQLNEAYDRYLSVAINSFLPHRLSRLCQDFNARLIHISTDCVFSGEKGSYCETDESDAKDLYGKSKYLGETDDTEKNAITLRTSIIGHELKSDTHGLLEWFIKQENKRVKGFKKAIYTGFTTTELINIMVRLINQHPELYGLYHVASDPISKYDLLHLINDIYKLNVTIEADNDFFCERSMIMPRFTEVTGYKAPSWKQMILEMYKEKGNK